ncbi:glycosyltransferase [Parasporobacterium paucivorans]|uniref:Glycosyltransferase 2-like domain-containing protein n=1 Tax=Parasporobacterium paucivorans DSM 15970 TaxID=1122934 RepID=A0A1M6EAD6_9FIRM|nr:glycosyltransferase family 2 protein [Parasporobacterium paucivorans]SHI82477.1 hypothetical protein SAMN02745691_00908 [Parasporobacterium paucivorans DSM 15970]
MNKAETAIIVLNYKKYEDTIKCVTQLLSLDVKLMIVIVDNNSPNDSFSVLSDTFQWTESVHLIKTNKNGGYSYGNNCGIKKALEINPDLEYISIMNPDALVTDERVFTDMLFDFERESSSAAIAPLMIEQGAIQEERSGWLIPNAWDRVFARTVFARKKKRNAKMKGPYRIVEAIHGSFFIVKRQVFQDVEYFDENVFLYGEETILGIKIKQLGKKELIDTRYKYYHNHQYSIEDESKVIQNGKIMYSSLRYLFLKYYNPSRLAKMVFILVQGSLYYVYYPIKLQMKKVLYQGVARVEKR